MGSLCFSSWVVMCRSASEKQNQVISEETLNRTKQTPNVMSQKNELAYAINALDDVNLDTASGMILLFSCITPNSNTTPPPLIISILPQMDIKFKFL